MGLAATQSQKKKSLHCPNCKGELVQVLQHGRMAFFCPRQHGRALAATTLRSWLVADFQRDFESALAVASPNKRLCPHCSKCMSLSRFHGLPLEHCRPCSVTWISDALLERLPLRPVRERDNASSLSLPFDIRVEPNLALVKELRSPFEGVHKSSVFPAATLLFLAAFCVITISFILCGESETFVAFPRQPYRLFGAPLVLSLFTHGSLGHLVGNGYFMFVAGSVLESMLGWRKYLILFFLCGFSGAVGSALVSAEGSIGASGAISGLVIALVALQPRGRYVFRSSDLFPGVPILPNLFSLSLRVPLWLWAFFWFSFDLYGMSQQLHGAGDHIGHGAHLGGAVAGALLACSPYFQERNRPVLS